jgi:hypothetical protein
MINPLRTRILSCHEEVEIIAATPITASLLGAPVFVVSTALGPVIT